MDRLLHLLPSKCQPLGVRYGATIVITGALSLVQYAIWLLSGDTAFFILLPAVFFSGLAFDRGSGILSALLASVIIVAQRGDNLGRMRISIVLFFVVAVGIAFVSETMRKALELGFPSRTRIKRIGLAVCD